MAAALRKGFEGVSVTESSHSSTDGNAGELVDREALRAKTAVAGDVPVDLVTTIEER